MGLHRHNLPLMNLWRIGRNPLLPKPKYHLKIMRFPEVIPSRRWEKSEKHSTDSQIFYIEEGHENDEKPDNISIHVGKNKYSLEEHEQFRDAIVQQILMQLDGIEAQLNGDGTYTEQGDLLYIFTIDEGDIVTTQYYIVKDYGFCLIQLTNFSGSETTEQAARDMVDSFVWDTEG